MQNHKLFRCENDKMIAGVCAGLAEFFGLDVSLVRLVAVLLALLGGHGLLVYAILWIVVPKAPGAYPVTQNMSGPQP
ncbi:MAG TPA: PspC domain-containing protein [Anaerolineaceae bacterium]|jgi:phage shock protein C